MENFNKNWLAIILIVIVFTAIGFLFGHLAASHHFMKSRHEMKDMMFFRHGGGGCCDEFNIPLDDETLDSLENLDVKVWVEKDGDVMKCDTVKKVIVKKIIK